jgi:hypothetical protein
MYGKHTYAIHIKKSTISKMALIRDREVLTKLTCTESVLPQATTVKYLGIHIDRRLTWKPHIHNKRKQLGLLLQRMYWITGRKSKLPLSNKLLIYKVILKPISTYGIPLWGTASQSNIEILQRLQNGDKRTVVRT